MVGFPIGLRPAPELGDGVLLAFQLFANERLVDAEQAKPVRHIQRPGQRDIAAIGIGGGEI